MAKFSSTQQRLWLWPITIPIFPPVLALIVLLFIGVIPLENVLANSVNVAAKTELVYVLEQNSYRLLFGGCAVAHIVLCTVACIYYAKTICRIHFSDYTQIYLTIFLGSTGVIFIMLFYSDKGQDSLAIFHYTYFNILKLLSTLNTENLTLVNPDKVGLYIMLPAIPGILSVMFAAGANSSILKTTARIQNPQLINFVN